MEQKVKHRERERERDFLQVKFNVSDEVTFQNGFNVSDETLKMGTESTDPIIPIYDK